MGKITDRFGTLSFRNEAEVSQNLLIPILTDHLGYALDDIIPEHQVPAFNVPQNRNKSISSKSIPISARPDFIVTHGDLESKVFICDAKDPHEQLERHEEQLKAYCIGLGVNLLVIANGHQLRIFNANELLFQSEDIADLEQKYSQVHILLCKENVAQLSLHERIQRMDLSVALGSANVSNTPEIRRNAALIADYVSYLREILGESNHLEMPQPIEDALSLDTNRFPPQQLYIFSEYEAQFSIPTLKSHAKLVYETLLTKPVISNPILIIGESGIGKTQLCQQILYDRTQECLANQSEVIPVMLKLGNYNSARTIQEHIFDTLYGKGANIQYHHMLELLRDGRLFLILDAFDEVPDIHASSCEAELKTLVENYRKTGMLITTRHFRLPNVPNLEKYQVQPIAQQQIQDFARFYLGERHSEFIRSLKERHLTKVASNTLFLRLLIFIFSKENRLPQGRAQILQTVVDRVRNHNDAKGKRYTRPISWDSRLRILSRLAYAAGSSPTGYILDSATVKTTIRGTLGVLEQERHVPAGLTLEEVMEQLVETGFISSASHGIAFWHRAFMEHFAAYEIAERTDVDSKILGDLIRRPEFDVIVYMAVGKTNSPEYHIEMLLHQNVFIAARASLECSYISEPQEKRVVDTLEEKCKSHQYAVRQTAVGILLQFRGKYSDDVFERILLNNPYVDIQTIALVEIAQRKLPNARKLVNARLSWHVPETMPISGSSLDAVFTALSIFDDEVAQQEIISIWCEHPDMFTSTSCENAFIRIAERNSVFGTSVDELFELFMKEPEPSGVIRLSLKNIFVVLQDIGTAQKLISKIRKLDKGDHFSLSYHAVDILAAYSNPYVIQALIENVSDFSLGENIRSIFAAALCESKGEVKFEVFHTLSKDEYQVRRYAIQALTRFDFSLVKPLVLSAIHPPEDEDIHEAVAKGYADVQNAAFEALKYFKQLELLDVTGNWPNHIVSICIETLCEGIVEQKLVSLLPLLARISLRWPYENEQIKIAWAFADLGEINHAKSIIMRILDKRKEEEQRNENWIEANIAEGVYRLSEDFAFEVIDALANDKTDMKQLRRSTIIGTLLKIGTSKARDRILYIAREAADASNYWETQEALRTLEALASPDLEDWTLNLLKDHPNMERFALRRAIELLGIVAGTACLPTLLPFLESEPSIQQTAFWAIQEIYKRNGQVWFNNEEKCNLC